MSEIMRLVVTGTVGAGKSTFIRTISEIEAVDTDRAATDETALLKRRTTVAFDFGRLRFSPEMVLHLYGTPGQERFDFMWDLLIRKAHAYILLVAAHRPREFRAARRVLNFMEHRVEIPMIVGITHCDCPGAWSTENIALALGYDEERERPPMVTLDANQPAEVMGALIVLLEHLLSRVMAAC